LRKLNSTLIVLKYFSRDSFGLWLAEKSFSCSTKTACF